MNGTNRVLVNPATNVNDVPPVNQRWRQLHIAKADLLERIAEAATNGDVGFVLALGDELRAIVNQLNVPY